MSKLNAKNHFDAALLHELGRAAPRIARWVILVTTLLIAGGVVWAARTNVPGLARAPGELTAQGPLRKVQHVEGGIIEEILKAEGDIVAQGEVIAQLSPSELDLQILRVEDRLQDARLRQARLEALLQARSDGPASAGANASASASASSYTRAPGFDAETFRLQSAQIALRTERRRAAAGVIEERAGAISTMEAIEAAISERVALAQERYARAQILLGKGVISNERLQEVEDALTAIRGEHLTATANLAASRGRHADAVRGFRELLLSDRQEDLAALEEVRAELKDLATSHKDLRLQRERLTVRAPVDGTLQAMAVSIAGEVIEPGGTVATILPTGVDLVAEIRIAPRDIGSVDEGDAVTISTSSFDKKRFGQIKGTVGTISATSVVEQGEDPYFKVSVDLEQQAIGEGADRRSLRAGMMVQAEIITTDRTVAEYLVKPLATTLSAALRER